VIAVGFDEKPGHTPIGAQFTARRSPSSGWSTCQSRGSLFEPTQGSAGKPGLEYLTRATELKRTPGHLRNLALGYRELKQFDNSIVTLRENRISRPGDCISVSMWFAAVDFCKNFPRM
jgi:hypothetical protein